MKVTLSIITCMFLIYGIFEIKSTLEDKKTIQTMDKVFHLQSKQANPVIKVIPKK